MLKFTEVQLVDDEDIKGMIFVVRQHKALACIELYANIQLHTLPTTNPQTVSHELQYYPYPIIHIHLMQSKTLFL